jgi:hypothetical protein
MLLKLAVSLPISPLLKNSVLNPSRLTSISLFSSVKICFAHLAPPMLGAHYIYTIIISSDELIPMLLYNDLCLVLDLIYFVFSKYRLPGLCLPFMWSIFLYTFTCRLYVISKPSGGSLF